MRLFGVMAKAMTNPEIAEALKSVDMKGVGPK